MEENYSAADEYDNLEDIFEDIPEDQVEETEREIRNLRKWFDILRKNIVMMNLFLRKLRQFIFRIPSAFGRFGVGLKFTACTRA